VLLDTKGPEIRYRNKMLINFVYRSGKLVDHCDKKLIAGSTFTFHNDDNILGDSTQVSTSYKSLARTVIPGDRILVDDGLIGMLVTAVDVVKVKYFYLKLILSN
jgi:pyruvate kinase